MPLTTKKPLLILAVASVLILAVVGGTYRSTTVLAEKTIDDRQQAIADEAAKMTKIWLGQQTQILDATVASVKALPLGRSPDVLRPLQMAMKAGHFSDVYIGTTEGLLIDGAGWQPPADYDPRQRPWFRHAVVNGHTTTTPYFDLVTQKLVMALVSPLVLDGRFRGVIGADTILDTLVANLSSVKVGETGYAFIVNNEGTILVHPDPNYPMKVRLQDTDPSLHGILERFSRSPSGTLSYSREGQKQILAYTKVADTNWYLCTTIPREEAYRIAHKTTVLFATEIVLKVLGGIALVTLAFAFGSALVLFAYNRRFTTTLQQQQEEISGINQDLAWNIHKRKELEKHYQTLFNVANDVILVSKDLYCIECNEKATEVFNLSRLGLIGRSLLDLSPAFQPDGQASGPRAHHIIEEALAGKHQIFEWTFQRPNGGEFPAEVSLKTLKLDNEQLCLYSIRDISKRVNAEQQLRQAQKMSAMGEMLGAIAHQWRQPLNTLSTYIASLQSAYLNNGISRSFVDTLVTGADAQIQFMSKTIDDFRHFFRPSKNKETFDVARAVGGAVKLLEPTLKQGEIALEMQVDPDRRFVVYGYPSEFVHVVVNIIANARDAIGERLSERAAGRTGRIAIDVDADNEDVVVRVRDNGGGIPDHLMDKIFTPYFTTKGATTGTGIGLYMAKMIVEKEMKGKLLAANIEGGAQLTIHLPKTARAG
jgi:PAS domain S-box-containing protein